MMPELALNLIKSSAGFLFNTVGNNQDKIFTAASSALYNHAASSSNEPKDTSYQFSATTTVTTALVAGAAGYFVGSKKSQFDTQQAESALRQQIERSQQAGNTLSGNISQLGISQNNTLEALREENAQLRKELNLADQDLKATVITVEDLGKKINRLITDNQRLKEQLKGK